MKTVIVKIAPDGSITVDAVGFKGVECDKATEALEKALGTQSNRKNKPEYHEQPKMTRKAGR